MRIETIEIAGFASALKALRLPFGRSEKSIITTAMTNDGYVPLAYAYHPLAYAYHLTFDTDVMIDTMDLTLMRTLVNRGDEHAKVVRGIIVYAKITAPIYWWCEAETYRAGHERLCSESTMHIDCKGLQGDDLVKAKEEIPMGKELTKVDFFSYQCLRNIYKQRKNHRLPQWREFCDWIATLPFADELITCGL